MQPVAYSFDCILVGKMLNLRFFRISMSIFAYSLSIVIVRERVSNEGSHKIGSIQEGEL